MMADDCTTLRYRASAAEWTDALPLGNGRLGAMCFGGVEEDRFQLNENTGWSGAPFRHRTPVFRHRTPVDGPATLASTREALARGDVRAAEAAMKRLQGGHSQAYQPLADLWITQPAAGEPTVYQRHLDMRSAVASHTFATAAGRVSQEAWIGPQALVIRRRMQPATTLRIRLTSPHPTAVTRVSRVSGGGLELTVRMPSDVPPVPAPVEYGPGAVTAVVELRVFGAGRITVVGEEIVFEGGDEVVLVVAAVTDFVDPLTSPHGRLSDLRRTLRARLDTVGDALGREGGYTALRAAHEREHLRLFSRAGVRLGSPEATARLDTADRLRAHAAGESDPALAALQFQYGRYLLIASSRPGGLPNGLQGLWNDQVRPPWNGNYTTNINLEMNYWPALVANLAECHEPLLAWLGHASRAGAAMVLDLYGMDGWTLHHNSDAWCFARPAGAGADEVRWSFWPLAGAWLARHAWEHHAYTGDAFSLPLLKGAAEFCLSWLIDRPDGTLGTAPSTSPENEYLAPDGHPTGAAVSTTADLVLIRDLLTHVVSLFGPPPEAVHHPLSAGLADPSPAAGVSAAGGGVDVALARRAEEALRRLPAERVGADGRLAEWSADVADAEPGHRHTSHLLGVFPGDSVDPDRTPALAVAARRALDARGLESTGWSLAWRVALRARLRDPAGAFAAVQRFLQPAGSRAGVYRNLFCAHPPFQIDGNFGFTAGVAEMLLQSHNDEIHLLPALPDEWSEGAFAGLRARGGLTVDAGWSGGMPYDVRLTSDTDRAVTVRFADKRIHLSVRAGVVTLVQLENGRSAFLTSASTWPSELAW